jgi:recombination protein RecA
MANEQPSEPKLLSVNAFEDYVNKTYKTGVVASGDPSKNKNLFYRLSSGILSLDCALGGGWPFGKISLITGEYSTGKTLLALKAAESLKSYDKLTHKYKDQVTHFTPCTCLWVSAEDSFPSDWAAVHGWDFAKFSVAKPEYGEQAVDIVTTAIRSDLFDLIVVDSIAAMIPIKELEESAEDAQMGLQARMINKAMRKWVGSLIKVSQESARGHGAALLCINQFRLKIGLTYGDPRTMPGGRMQEYASSIIVYTKSSTVVDDSKAEHGMGEYQGLVYKNKTFQPKVSYSFKMALANFEDWKKGKINNTEALFKLADKFGLIKKDGKEWTVGVTCFDTKAALEKALETDEKLRRLVWRSIVKAYGGDVS